MKVKSLVTLAISGLLVGSFAYITPAIADDINNNQSIQQPANANNAQPLAQYDTPANSTNMNSNMNSNTQPAPSPDNPSANSLNNNTTTQNPPDQNTPDTATGDDDY